jgi:hypothetical protein
VSALPLGASVPCPSLSLRARWPARLAASHAAGTPLALALQRGVAAGLARLPASLADAVADDAARTRVVDDESEGGGSGGAAADGAAALPPPPLPPAALLRGASLRA